MPMARIWRLVRLNVAEMFLELSFVVMPDGPEKVHLASLVRRYIESNKATSQGE